MANRKIIRGQDATIVVDLVKPTSCNDGTTEPFKLDGFTSATGKLPAELGGAVSVSGTLVSEDLGRLSFVFSDTNTLLLSVEDNVNMEVTVIRGTITSIAQIIGKIDVADTLFP